MERKTFADYKFKYARNMLHDPTQDNIDNFNNGRRRARKLVRKKERTSEETNTRYRRQLKT